MLIQTQGDARAAVLQASDDILATASNLGSAYIDPSVFSRLSGNAISDATEASAAGLLNDLASLTLSINDSLTGSDSDPLLQPQIDAMKSLQTQIINARQLIGQVISKVDWTFGDYLSDFSTTAVNTASQAVGAISKGLGINWTYVKWGAAIGGVLLFWALYQRVRG